MAAISMAHCCHRTTTSFVDVESQGLLLPTDYQKLPASMSSASKLFKRTPNAVLLPFRADDGNRDNYEPTIQYPIYVGQDIGSQYDWNLFTVPQMQLDGLTRPLPQGKVLGGGSILNGMCWNRGGRDDYDAWAALGNPGWGWTDLLPYFKKVSPE